MLPQHMRFVREKERVVKVFQIDAQIKFIVMRFVCTVIAFFLMIIGVVFIAPPLMSLIVTVTGFFVLVASFGAVDKGDVQRIAGVGLMALALIFFMFGVNPELLTDSSFQVKSLSGEVLCDSSKEKPCTLWHLEPAFYTLFWR